MIGFEFKFYSIDQWYILVLKCKQMAIQYTMHDKKRIKHNQYVIVLVFLFQKCVVNNYFVFLCFLIVFKISNTVSMFSIKIVFSNFQLSVLVFLETHFAPSEETSKSSFCFVFEFYALSQRVLTLASGFTSFTRGLWPFFQCFIFANMFSWIYLLTVFHLLTFISLTIVNTNFKN